MKIKSIYFLIMVFLTLLTNNLHARENNFGPWDTPLVKKEKYIQPYSAAMPSTSAWFFNRFIRFFQIFISPQDGPNCRYTPTCSQYSMICINQYGPFLGIIMFGDRFMRCNPFGAYGEDLPEENYFAGKGNK